MALLEKVTSPDNVGDLLAEAVDVPVAVPLPETVSTAGNCNAVGSVVFDATAEEAAVAVLAPDMPGM